MNYTAYSDEWQLQIGYFLNLFSDKAARSRCRFLPIATALGWDPIWFGIYIILVMEMGAITPPVGLNCFIISGVAKDVSLGTIYKGVIPFTITIIVGVVLVTVFPKIILLLPSLAQVAG